MFSLINSIIHPTAAKVISPAWAGRLSELESRKPAYAWFRRVTVWCAEKRKAASKTKQGRATGTNLNLRTSSLHQGHPPLLS